MASAKFLIARNGTRLDKLLRLAYSEGIAFSVGVEKTEKGKIQYRVTFPATMTETKYLQLKEKYYVMTN